MVSNKLSCKSPDIYLMMGEIFFMLEFLVYRVKRFESGKQLVRDAVDRTISN